MDAEVSTYTFLTMIIEEYVCFMLCEPFFLQLFLCGTHGILYVIQLSDRVTVMQMIWRDTRFELFRGNYRSCAMFTWWKNIYKYYEFSLLHIFSLILQPWMSAYIRKTDGVYISVIEEWRQRYGHLEIRKMKIKETNLFNTQLDVVFKKKVKSVIYLLFSYQTGYIMWH
jgi:hypothetical protein